MSDAVSEQIDLVFEHIDQPRLTRLLADTVDTYSPSYAEEAVIEVLCAALDEVGLAYELQRVSEEDEVPVRANIIVELGPQPPEIVLVGHVDTISAWGEEGAEARLEAGCMYGLGTADMKSGCCAMVEALAAVSGAKVELGKGVMLALVVGEEEYGDGSETFLSEHNPGLTVIGEPTGLAPCTEHFGYAEFVLESEGNPAHAAFPELGANAIYAMLAWLSRLLEQMREVSHPEQIAVNPREISGGSDLFIVADRCTASVDVHLGPKIDHDEVIALFDRARAEVLEEHPACELSFEEHFYAPSYRLTADDRRLAPVRRAFDVAERDWEPAVFRSHSDGNMFRQHGALPVICGPGRLEVAHTRHEHVELAEVHRAARLYAAMVVAACVDT